MIRGGLKAVSNSPRISEGEAGSRSRRTLKGTSVFDRSVGRRRVFRRDGLGRCALGDSKMVRHWSERISSVRDGKGVG